MSTKRKPSLKQEEITAKAVQYLDKKKTELEPTLQSMKEKVRQNSRRVRLKATDLSKKTSKELQEAAEKYQVKERASKFKEEGEKRALMLGHGMKEQTEKFREEYIEGTKLDKYIDKVDEAAAFMVNKKDYQYDNEVVGAASGPIRFGLWLFLIFFVFLGSWSAFAPIQSAAIAMGVVVVDSNKKSIQHLEGGIISEFMVKEGDKVKQGDSLILLDDTKAKASWEIYKGQMRSYLAVEARLMAEQDGSDTITFPEELNKLGSMEEIEKVKQSEINLFDYRKKSLEGQVAVLEQRVKQLEDEIHGLEAQEKSASTQLALINEEVEVVQKLVDEGRAVRPRLLELQRNAANLEGSRGEYQALIARAGQSIAENRLSIINLRNERMSDIVDELKQVQVNISDTKERITATKDTLERVLITAPTDGVVTALKYHTVGGVIRAGDPILDIVPQEDEKIIEAQVSPEDIDSVYIDLKANVRISAYKRRTVPTLEGTVIYVSADRFVDKNTGVPYYLARVEIDKVFMEKLEEPLDLKPGMPAEVHIITGKKTPLGYMLDPITSFFGRAFKEE